MAPRIAEGLQALGYCIWRDEDLPPTAPGSCLLLARRDPDL